MLNHRKSKGIKKKKTTPASLTMLKPLTGWMTANWKILKEMGKPGHLTCLLRNLHAGQKAIVKSRHGQINWFKTGKGVHQAVYCHPVYLMYTQNTSWKMPGWMIHKFESKLLGEISITSDIWMTPPLWQKAERN